MYCTKVIKNAYETAHCQTFTHYDDLTRKIGVSKRKTKNIARQQVKVLR